MPIPDALLQETITLLRELVKVDTTNPGKPEEPAAGLVSDYLTRHGISSQMLASEPGRTSVIARVRGTSRTSPALLLLSHLDTVPVPDAEVWDYGPFSGELADGFIWGRGALDDKGRTAINAAVLTLLQQSPPSGDVLFVAAADEEEGGNKGVRWLRNHHPESLAAPYALGEGGGYKGASGRRSFYTYSIAEKGAFRVRIRFRGEAGHAAVPSRVSPAVFAAHAALRVTRIKWPWTPTEPAVRFLHELAHGQPTSRALALRELSSRTFGPFLRGRGLPPEQRDAIHAMFHNTVAITLLRAGQGSGALPGQAELVLSVRYLAGTGREEVLNQIRHSLAGLASQPEVTIEGEAAPRSSPPDSPLATAIKETMTRLDPGVDVLPVLLPASTDLRELEAVTYGFTPLRKIPAHEIPKLAHGRNERLALDDIALGIEATAEIARRLGVLATP